MKTTRDSYQGIGASHALKALRTADLIRWVAANKPGMTVDTTEDAPESWANMLWTIEDGEDRVCMIRAVDISKRSYRNASYGSEVVWVAHGEFFPSASTNLAGLATMSGVIDSMTCWRRHFPTSGASTRRRSTQNRLAQP